MTIESIFELIDEELRLDGVNDMGLVTRQQLINLKRSFLHGYVTCLHDDNKISLDAMQAIHIYIDRQFLV